LNGENNKSKGIKDKKDPLYKYTSTSRTNLRLMWFMDMIWELINNLLNTPDKKLSKCGKEAYETALAHHHPFAVRTAAKVGFMTISGRDGFVGKFTESKDKKEQIDRLEGLRDGIKIVKTHLWKFYEEKELTKLP
jgi:hypothetical protein